MTARSFMSFAEASAFAKQIAKQQRKAVRIVRLGNEFVVEVISPRKLSPTMNLSSIPAVAQDRPAKPVPPAPSSSVESVTDARLCIECGVVIPQARVEAMPTVSRCVKCQSIFEQANDTRPHIDEGLPGSREAHKKMRGQLWGDIRNRGRGR